MIGLGEECRNTVGSYECLCADGFQKDQRTNGRYCLDVNECDLDQCPRNSECINTQGSFYCRCHRGFTKVNGQFSILKRIIRLTTLKSVSDQAE